jgi:hypothetical protein
LPGAAPVAVDLGFAPAALVLWWSCQTDDAVAAGNRGGIGFAAAGSDGASVAWISEDGASSARTASWAAAQPVVGLGAADAPPTLRADVDFGEAGFTVRPTATGAPWRLHFLALGGAGIDASVGWCRGGDERVELGFRGDLVLVAGVRAAELETQTRGLSLGIGAAARGSGQAAVALVSPDGAAPGSVAGAQRIGSAFLGAAGRETLDVLGALAFEDDGLRLDWQTAPHDACYAYLALGGVRGSVAPVWSPLRPARRRTRLRFRPEALLAFTWGLGESSGPSDIGRVCLGGAADANAAGATSWDDRDTPGSTTATHVHSSSDLVLVADTQTGGVHAAASPASFARRGFTLRWTRSDGARRQIVVVALAGRGATSVRARLRRALRR